MNRITLRKVTLAATLTALSVVIDILFKQFIPASIQNVFGLPFYAIPLIIGAMLLGPIYGLLMAIVSDYFATMASGFAYMPLFVLAAVVWGVIPGLLIKSKDNYLKIFIVILITHILATFFNTLALEVYGWLYLDKIFYVRLTLVPVNSIIITSIIYQVNRRLTPIYEDFKRKTSE
ncbi:folate family ECF transporter S component [Acholeplasma hippikon]|uniref:Predicted membrane protein n=1 Tax=Acholeplasma hippikon TaxID=264636 RepID=A0A449BLA9_9MOLU|nr:folate family ECF transporter S component [Acholeplasma hippikon]VEU83207.1 Predicted membrane protein [Acholeplasma hippikon]